MKKGSCALRAIYRRLRRNTPRPFRECGHPSQAQEGKILAILESYQLCSDTGTDHQIISLHPLCPL